jgi:hypothetical protein
MFKLQSSRFERPDRLLERVPVGYWWVVLLILSLALWTGVVMVIVRLI